MQHNDGCEINKFQILNLFLNLKEVYILIAKNAIPSGKN